VAIGIVQSAISSGTVAAGGTISASFATPTNSANWVCAIVWYATTTQSVVSLPLASGWTNVAGRTTGVDGAAAIAASSTATYSPFTLGTGGGSANYVIALYELSGTPAISTWGRWSGGLGSDASNAGYYSTFDKASGVLAGSSWPALVLGLQNNAGGYNSSDNDYWTLDGSTTQSLVWPNVSFGPTYTYSQAQSAHAYFTADPASATPSGAAGVAMVIIYGAYTPPSYVAPRFVQQSTTVLSGGAQVPDIRITIYDPMGQAPLTLDASTDAGYEGVVYADIPQGSDAATITLRLPIETTIADGYWTAGNIVEISTGDDYLQAAYVTGSNKIYVSSLAGYAASFGHDLQQLYLYTLGSGTSYMLVQVVGSGTDSGGAYLTLAGTGATIPNLPAGTIVGRRRYAGRIVRRELTNDRTPQQIITCAGLYTRLDQQNGSFTFTSYDVGSAIYQSLLMFAPTLPEFNILLANFPTVGLTYTGTSERVGPLAAIANILSAVSTGDTWIVRVGHDRTPRLVRLFTLSSNTYTYPVSIAQDTAAPFAVNLVKNVDQDATNMYNVVEVIGDTDPITKQPVRAIVYDAVDGSGNPVAGSPMALYGRIEATPVSNSSLKTVTACAAYGQALLSVNDVPAQASSFRIYTRGMALLVDSTVAPPYGTPAGLQRGDCIIAVQCVTLTGFTLPAPSLYGLVQTTKTTIQPGRDTWQDVQFSAIEPDHNAAIAEHANAVATAIRQNTSPPAFLDQYTVAANAVDHTSAGLTVTNPTFTAAFGRPANATTTPVVTVGGNTLTLTANATNYVYLSPGNVWTVIAHDATPVVGAIFYGIYTTNSSTVIGFWPKASVGIASSAAIAGSIVAATAIPTVATAFPSSPSVGQECYRTDLSTLYVWTGSAWSSAASGAGATTLAALTDVATSSPTTGQVLTYNAATGKWVNAAGGSGGGGVSSVAATAPLVSSGGTTPTISLPSPLPVANGGSGSAAPALVAGANVTLSGSWPNQTISASGSGGTAVTYPVAVQSNPNGNAGVTSHPLVFPVARVVGSILVVFTAGPATAVSGYTLLGGASTVYGAKIWIRTATNTSADNPTVTFSSTGANASMCIEYANAATPTVVAASGAIAYVPNAPTIAAPAGSLVVALWVTNYGGTYSPPGWSFMIVNPGNLVLTSTLVPVAMNVTATANSSSASGDVAVVAIPHA
jgi:hypothetical protein